MKTYDGSECFFKAFVVAIVWYFPVMYKFLAHKTHTSQYGCTICSVKEVEYPVKSRFYFVCDKESNEIRQKNYFGLDAVYQLIWYKRFHYFILTCYKIQETQGIKHSTPLKFLACFSGSSFLCLDEVYLLSHHTAKDLWKLMTSDTGVAFSKKKTFFLWGQW